MLKTISIIVPVYNEEKNVIKLHEALAQTISSMTDYNFDFVFVNDGSRDGSQKVLQDLADKDPRVRVISFSKNFGKEMALSAGINNCAEADACLMMDADLQHPVELIPEFIKKWESGADVVIGVREKNKGEGIIKHLGSVLFYKIINSISDTSVKACATDYRLIDHEVIESFNRFTEKNRMTRALIDWLGYERNYIYFQANERTDGKAGYSFFKLVRLAMNSFISLSLFPLKLAGYLGIIITLVSGIIGLYILIGKYILHNSIASSFSGPAQLAILIVFLVGVILICLGLIALYIAHIHGEIVNRPMYVINKKKSKLDNSRDD